MKVSCRLVRIAEKGFFNARQLLEKAEKENNEELKKQAQKELEYFALRLKQMGSEIRES